MKTNAFYQATTLLIFQMAMITLGMYALKEGTDMLAPNIACVCLFMLNLMYFIKR